MYTGILCMLVHYVVDRLLCFEDYIKLYVTQFMFYKNVYNILN